MTKETVNTNYELPAPSRYNLYVESLTRKCGKRDPSVIFYSLRVITQTEKPLAFNVAYFKNQMDELLRALGAEEPKSGVFEFDPDEMSGKWITASVDIAPDKAGIDRASLSNIVAYSAPETGVNWDGEEQKAPSEDEPNL